VIFNRQEWLNNTSEAVERYSWCGRVHHRIIHDEALTAKPDVLAPSTSFFANETPTKPIVSDVSNTSFYFLFLFSAPFRFIY
jgi:hypothetical protein